MKLTVKLFAMLGEQLGPTVTIDVAQPNTAAMVKPALCQQAPALKTLINNARIAVNQEFIVDGQQVLQSTDEVALIPPVSGG
ncbi:MULTISPECIES: MoaD/ThiS family protein [Lactiplantibacillus]|jgi:molybdopterin converting factor subunit 1|nr:MULTISPECIES: MoaD/ThiS family protein [Lactiplantibacillus]AYJ41700.1 MoaD/ThiS family protein [Lactiplantibacillus pentosus]MBU7447012.1 MoaD/ThiS family protein [Lactiplantibacillus sp. 7.2.4]MBU7479192.1 MoaD/ThiS family protein [Lactiplantibacillus pentosus]MBU7497337.1 MoaD/ThiS family protein [Lactiplantibacillus pentosus]MBU7502973.1 MoaD/ThiS family protein [Lactiplantibacillus pentosus]